MPDQHFHKIFLIASLWYVSFAVHQQVGPSGFLSACNNYEPPHIPPSHFSMSPITFLNHQAITSHDCFPQSRLSLSLTRKSWKDAAFLLQISPRPLSALPLPPRLHLHSHLSVTPPITPPFPSLTIAPFFHYLFQFCLWSLSSIQKVAIMRQTLHQ